MQYFFKQFQYKGSKRIAIMTAAQCEKEARERIKMRTKGETSKGKWKGGIWQTPVLSATSAHTVRPYQLQFCAYRKLRRFVQVYLECAVLSRTSLLHAGRDLSAVPIIRHRKTIRLLYRWQFFDTRHCALALLLFPLFVAVYKRAEERGGVAMRTAINRYNRMRGPNELYKRYN